MFKKEDKPIIVTIGKNKDIYWNQKDNSFKIGDIDLYKFIQKYNTTEDQMAEWIIDNGIEGIPQELMIAKFNEIKKEKLIKQDKVNNLRQKILQMYK
jgi:hypothetical protein